MQDMDLLRRCTLRENSPPSLASIWHRAEVWASRLEREIVVCYPLEAWRDRVNLFWVNYEVNEDSLVHFVGVGAATTAREAALDNRNMGISTGESA